MDVRDTAMTHDKCITTDAAQIMQTEYMKDLSPNLILTTDTDGQEDITRGEGKEIHSRLSKLILR
uniref:Uncharacterized protein n=1 Tax=Octopus bimaculoides TaxID=37653 RepID=A0A0L8I7J5_OCTBM